jgi:hypothetical protein
VSSRLPAVLLEAASRNPSEHPGDRSHRRASRASRREPREPWRSMQSRGVTAAGPRSSAAPRAQNWPAVFPAGLSANW